MCAIRRHCLDLTPSDLEPRYRRVNPELPGTYSLQDFQVLPHHSYTEVASLAQSERTYRVQDSLTYLQFLIVGSLRYENSQNRYTPDKSIKFSANLYETMDINVGRGASFNIDVEGQYGGLLITWYASYTLRGSDVNV